jgi:hypothetical protein
VEVPDCVSKPPALPQSTAVVSIDRDDVSRELRARADDVRGVLERQGLQARETLQNLLVDRVDCTFQRTLG